MSETRDAVLKAIDHATDVVRSICHGHARWTMSVPARPETDSDLVIMSALRESEGEILRLRAEVAALREMAGLVEDGRTRWVQVAEELLPYLRDNPQPVTIDVRERPTMPRVLDLVVTRYACPECAALREDAARLDWIERAVPTGEFRERIMAVLGASQEAPLTGRWLRAALDAARAGEGGR